MKKGILALALIAVAAFVGCEREEDPATVEEAAEQATQDFEEAREETQETIQELGEDVEELGEDLQEQND
jgi:predicted small secreted protein